MWQIHTDVTKKHLPYKVQFENIMMLLKARRNMDTLKELLHLNENDKKYEDELSELEDVEVDSIRKNIRDGLRPQKVKGASGEEEEVVFFLHYSQSLYRILSEDQGVVNGKGYINFSI